jgi:hypothetical protein
LKFRICNNHHVGNRTNPAARPFSSEVRNDPKEIVVVVDRDHKIGGAWEEEEEDEKHT